ncbi:SDR family oxidoreductase [Vibrio ichthyoenteri]|nr:SDR family oxidoreductase [Vibrio ichthyoenteri]
MSYSLVTCANSGIAKAIINKFRSDGVGLTLMTRTKKDDHLELDFFSKESIEKSIEYLKINNISFDSLVLILPRIPPSANALPESDEWLMLFENYFVNPMFFLKELIKLELLKSDAKVVMISGVSSKQAMKNYALNNVIRSSWIAQMKTLALSFSSMSFNSVSLGGVLTESYINKMEIKAGEQGVSYDNIISQEVENVPMRKYATPEDVANVVVPLCGSFASHMTGQNIVVDGGFIKTYS